MNTFIMGGMLHDVLGLDPNSGFDSIAKTLVFTTILGATDPVAVVALLKDLGTSKTISTLIEGESLLNDGSAIVL
jgi:NhaP-type Na+/H+ or K+/H+ antiporter